MICSAAGTLCHASTPPGTSFKRGRGGGVWNPKVCGPKMAQIHISFCTFHFSRHEIRVRGGGDSSCGCQPFQSVPTHPGPQRNRSANQTAVRSLLHQPPGEWGGGGGALVLVRLGRTLTVMALPPAPAPPPPLATNPLHLVQRCRASLSSIPRQRSLEGVRYWVGEGVRGGLRYDQQEMLGGGDMQIFFEGGGGMKWSHWSAYTGKR